MTMVFDNYIIGGTFLVSLFGSVFLVSLFGSVLLFILRQDSIERRKSRKVLGNLRSKLTLLRAQKQENAPRKTIQAMISSLSVPALLVLLLLILLDGKWVRVIERDLTKPDRIVGELLQPGGCLKLAELGLEDCVEEIDAQRVLGYALFKDGRNTKLLYTLEKFHADVAGRSFHNGRFIRRMREKAATLPKLMNYELAIDLLSPTY
ncbi:hypothetical protein J1N35_022265 [Gossypium stocksii]|uniref:Squalene monooxygenase n=1 Tax=Gossypium stocksii TaxID=47602 RepID=A0A9D3VI68_9ROSI|nr:hypothetical protein J1N35_022265 [Gossypium stocksii]